ncbi:carbohydrate kinase family protein [Amaricoccus sp. W119]|uniref:carbohydrate kinase family protein n=1 Tax=Amaricoccus sp. W119 TaxID=3391833 RepID=UPI0039A5E930
MAAPEFICAGMIVADVLVEGFEAIPRAGETARVSGVSLAAGGDASNEAIALAKLGNRVGLMGPIGDDAQGRMIAADCARRGIATEGLSVDPDRPTTTGVVLIERGGERSFLSPANGTIGALGPEHIDLGLIRPGLRALSIGSLFTAARFDLEAVTPLLRRAKEVGAITIADMVMDQRGYGLDDLASAWPHLDYVVPSALEAELFTGLTAPRAIAARFRELGVRNVVLKRGSAGAIAFVGETEVTCPAFDVPVADTTGAGDNFVGGLVHALVKGFPIDQALRFASAVAALSVQAVGAGAGLRDLAQVEEFLARTAEPATLP